MSNNTDLPVRSFSGVFPLVLGEVGARGVTDPAPRTVERVPNVHAGVCTQPEHERD